MQSAGNVAITEHLITIVSLGVLLLVGLVPSRHEPDSSFLANQRWRYRDLIIVWGVLTVIDFAPRQGVSKMTGLPLWVIDGLATLLFAATVWSVVRWKHRRPWGAPPCLQATEPPAGNGS